MYLNGDTMVRKPETVLAVMENNHLIKNLDIKKITNKWKKIANSVVRTMKAKYKVLGEYP